MQQQAASTSSWLEDVQGSATFFAAQLLLLSVDW
jgi:hypothetical protein